MTLLVLPGDPDRWPFLSANRYTLTWWWRGDRYYWVWPWRRA